MEYCDLGSLDCAISDGRFADLVSASTERLTWSPCQLGTFPKDMQPALAGPTATIAEGGSCQCCSVVRPPAHPSQP